MAQEHRSEPMDDTAEPRLGSWWFAVVPALTLLVGLVLGGLVVGVTVDGEPESRTASTPAPVDPSPTEDVAVVVPQECLEAAQTVQEATALIRDGASAIREFRPDELITTSTTSTTSRTSTPWPASRPRPARRWTSVALPDPAEEAL